MNAELPPGWEWVRLGDILLSIEAGKSFTCDPRPAGSDEWGIIKVSAMTWGRFDATQNKAVPADKDVDPRYEIRSGDLLVSRANTEAYVGAPVLVDECRPRLLLSDKSMRLDPASMINKRWLLHILSSPIVRRQVSAKSSGTKAAMRNISQQALKDIVIPLPPADEQRRIADAVGRELDRLDDVDSSLKAAQGRLRQLQKSTLFDLVPEAALPGWRMTTVGDAGEIDLGRQRHPDWHTGPEMRPYLRVANVFEDRIDTRDVMQMDFSGVFDRFRLEPGDVLLNEGQSPELVGRPALYRGEPSQVAFTNSLLRFRAHADVLPEWALLVFRRHLHSGRFKAEVRITTNIAHLSATRLKTVEFPVPPLPEQEERVRLAAERFACVDQLDALIKHGAQQAQALRKSILDQAYKGGFAVSGPSDEPAGLLLKHIADEKATAENDQATKRRGRRTAMAAKAPSAGSGTASRLAAPTSTAPVPDGTQGAFFNQEYAK